MFILDRAKHIKAALRANCNEDKSSKKQADHSPAKDESCERILNEVSIVLWSFLCSLMFFI